MVVLQDTLGEAWKLRQALHSCILFRRWAELLRGEGFQLDSLNRMSCSASLKDPEAVQVENAHV